MQNAYLFICHTQYQVLATVAKMIDVPRVADILLSECIPHREALADNLKSIAMFRQVLLPVDEHLPCPPDHGLRLLLLHTVQRRAFKKAGFTLNPLTYDGICIYNDWTPLGRWLQDYGAHYTLGEDTRNHFAKPCNEYVEEQASAVDFKQRQSSGKGYLYWGGYKGVDQVEVSSAEGVPYYRDKLVVIDPLALIESFDTSQKAILRKVFISKDIPISDTPACLFMPRSLFVDRELPSQEAQNRLCKDVVKEYCNGYQLYIKTHPRDTTDYEALFPEATVLDRFMPSELLDYCFDIRFSRAVGICTASIKNLLCADEKISLEADILEPYCQ